MRFLPLLVSIIWASTSIDATSQEPRHSVKAGDLIVLNLGGDLAVEFCRLTRSITQNDRPEGLEVQVIALAERIEKDKVRVRLDDVTRRKDQKDRMVVLTALVDTKEFERTFTPKGTVVYASPGDYKAGGKGKPTSEDAHGLKLTLKDPKDVTLRAWIAE